MSRLQAFIDRMLGRTNAEPNVVLGTADDGSSDPVEAGKLSPLRVDPTTGALLVKDTSGGSSGGTVDQGNAGSTSWKVVEDNSAAIKTSVDAVTTALGSPLQAGGNVAVTNFPATQPVSGTVAATQSGTWTEANSGTIATNTGNIDAKLPSGLTVSSTRLLVDPSGVTQPISASSLPLPALAATSTKQSDGTQKTQVTDGTNSAAVTNSSPSTEYGVVTRNIPSGTQTVSGTVTSNIGTTNGLALDTTLTDGSQVAIAKGPIAAGAAVGSEKPVLVGGSDGTNAQIVNVDSTGAVRLQSGGAPGSVAPSRATQIGGTDGTNLRALTMLNTATAGTEYGAVVRTASSALPTGAATSAKQPALGTAGSSSTDVLSVQGIASGTALPVSAASLPLPSGAATSAKQPALGTAGTASTDVITVQGIASGTAINVDTELPAAASLSDVMSNPTAPAVGAWMIGLNPGTGQGNRMPGISTTGFFVQGATNAGSAVSQRPLTVGGVDGSTNVRNFLTDTSGRLTVIGASASASAVAGNPVLVAGTNGTNAYSLKTDTSGRPDVTVNSSALPTGAATEATLATVASQTVNTELAPLWMRGPEDGFGRNVVVNPTPVIQSMFANGITIDIWRTYTTGTGTATSTAQTDSLATVSTGATGTSIAELTSTDTFSYRAGQSVRMLFTTLFSAPASGGFQAVGCGSNDGVAVGYNGTAFGFLIRRGGVSEVRTITITTASTTNQNVTVTLNGVGTSVAVTNSGNTVTTAREIAAGDYSASGNGWDAYQFGSTVIFVSHQPGPLSGTYSLTATTAVGSFAQTIAGVTPTDTWYAKTAWTHDRLDGATGANNRSGATIDPTKLSVWQAIVPYLGAGPVILQWQDPTTFRWTTCHVVAPANTATTPTVRNPMFRLWIRASGASNISTSSASMAMFCDGVVEPIGPRVAIPPSFKTTVGNASELPLVAVRTERIFNGSKNRAPFRPVEVAVSAGATGQVILRFYLNPTLTGANFGTVNGLHPLSYDTSATAISGGLLVGTIITSPSGGSTPISLLDLGYSLQPGDVVGVSAQQTSGTNGTVAIGLTGILDNGCGGI